MSGRTESRAAARRRRRRKLAVRVGLMAAVSLLVHLLLVPAASHWLLSAPPAKEPFQVRMVPPPRAKPEPPRPVPPPPKPPPKGQVVDVAPTKDTDVPDDARFLSEHDTHVEKETAARSRRPTDLPAAPELRRPSKAQAARAPEKKAEPQKETRKAEDAGKKLALADTGRAAPGREPEKAREDKPDPEPEETQPSPDRPVDLFPSPSAMRALAGAPAPDHLPNVAEGNATWLNSRSFKYASYFNNVKRAVGRVWDPIMYRLFASREDLRSGGTSNYVTVVVVTLDGAGNLEDVEVSRSSGVAVVDQAALDAFRGVGRFPNPPRGLADPDGRIRFDFGFIYTLEGSRFIYRRG